MSVSPPSPDAAPVGPLRRSLVLIGIMGAGKTSVGQVLARRLGVPFTDSDTEIETAAGLTVAEIFARFGEAYFRAGEARVIGRLLDGPPRVIATGGGAFVQDATRALIHAGGTSLWLRAALDVVYDRVKGKPGRPLLAGPDPRGALERLIAARDPVYALADIIVDSLAQERHEQAAERVLAAIRAHDAGVAEGARVLRGEEG